MASLKEIEAKLVDTGETQISLTDPDARSMMTCGSGSVGYNVQTAVDTKHHLIVEHEVTNSGSDRDQLSAMAKKARANWHSRDDGVTLKMKRSCMQSMMPPMRSSYELFKAPTLALPENCTPA